MERKKIDKESLNAFFDVHSKLDKNLTITEAMRTFGSTESTTTTYYYQWKKEFMKASEDADKLPITEKNSPMATVVIKEESAQDTGVISAEVAAKIIEEALEDEVVQINRLKPVLMVGRYGDYNFSDEGVKITPADEFLSKGKCEEALEALEIWEEHYGVK